MKKVQRISEGQLRAIVAESVQKILNEINIVGKIDNFERNKGYGDALDTLRKPMQMPNSKIDDERYSMSLSYVKGKSKEECAELYKKCIAKGLYDDGWCIHFIERRTGYKWALYPDGMWKYEDMDYDEYYDGTINEQEQPTFGDYFNRSKDYHIQSGRKYGFELRKDGEWKYGDIEYDPNEQTMSCMGISIKVQPNMTILDAEEDLFEELIKAGYDSDF